MRRAAVLVLVLGCAGSSLVAGASNSGGRSTPPVSLTATCLMLSLWNVDSARPIELPIMCTVDDSPTPYGQTDPPTFTPLPLSLDGAAAPPPSTARRPSFPPIDRSPGRRAGSSSLRGVRR